MDINFTCTHCNQTLVVDSTGAGETVSCPTCQQMISVPVDYIAKEITPEIKKAEDNKQVAAEQHRIAIDKIRNSARLAAEDHWRNFLTLVHIDKRKAVEAIYGFDATIKEMTQYMPEPDATFYRDTIKA